MTSSRALSAQEIRQCQRAVARGDTQRDLAARFGVAVATVQRALRKARTAGEFSAAGLSHQPARTRDQVWAWDLPSIRHARDEQMRGQFAWPARLARALRTDDAIFVARANRLAPLSAIALALEPYPSAAGRRVARDLAAHVDVDRSVLLGLAGTLVDHGLAVAIVRREPNGAGTKIRLRVEEWPIETIRWDPTAERLEAHVRDAGWTPVTHGDGDWIVFRRFESQPWTQDAAILPAALVWPAHANAVRDWAAATLAHGQSKLMGELPEGVPLREEDGSLTPEASAFIEVLQGLVNGDIAAGIRPANAKTEFVSSQSSAWQVFSEFLTNRERAAARIYQGTDAALGANTSAPGVDVQTLFGVAVTKVQGDTGTIERGLYEGLSCVWTALHYGDSRLAPRYRYALPDPDSDAKSVESAAKLDRLLAAVERLRGAGFAVAQGDVDRLAAEMGVEHPPTLAVSAASRKPLDLAPTDVARVVRVNEVRLDRGLPALDDERGVLFISELEAYAESRAAAPTEPAAP
jgi:hypothetical protein